MKKNSLISKGTGLSLSQAQSISNLCNQRATEIGYQISNVNNASKTVKVGEETHETVKARKLPDNVIDLLKEKAELHACQGFLMENITAKDALLDAAKKEQADISSIKFPEDYKYEDPDIIPQVKEEPWGWEQLSAAEINEYTQADAFAAHVGKFIHKGSTLDTLRAELPSIPDIEWMNIKDGEKSPVKIVIHHTSENLLKIHEELATIHRQYEQRVNYFKAKVKNLVTAENARIAKINADAQNVAGKINDDRQKEYETAYKKATEDMKSLKAEFEKTRQEKISEIAAMKIDVDPRFQPTIDIFLPKVTSE
jgi:hypothetical protein